MNWLDAVILLPLLIGLVRGLMRGLVTELIAILAVILGFIGARMWGHDFSAWIFSQFAWPQPVCDAVAYSLLFIGLAIALNILGKLFTKLLKTIHLGFVNRLLGGIFGALKWAVIVLTLVFIIDCLDRQFHFMKPELKNSSLTYLPAVKSANACFSVIRSESRK